MASAFVLVEMLRALSVLPRDLQRICRNGRLNRFVMRAHAGVFVRPISETATGMKIWRSGVLGQEDLARPPLARSFSRPFGFGSTRLRGRDFRRVLLASRLVTEQTIWNVKDDHATEASSTTPR